jgi:DNA topoisomerase-1
LTPTETGVLVNDLVVEYFPDVVDVGFTANMESDLDEVADGKREWAGVISEFYTSFEPALKRAQAEMPENKTLETIGRACPDCGKDLVIRYGRYGKFISCSGFPACRHTEAWLEKIGVTCPEDGGDLVMRKTRKGRIFYACSNYPNCNFTSWKKPVPTPCPKCGGLLVIANKTEVQCIKCGESFLQESLMINQEKA